MPIPTTRLNTTIAVSKVESRASIPPRSSAMQGLSEERRELLDTVQGCCRAAPRGAAAAPDADTARCAPHACRNHSHSASLSSRAAGDPGAPAGRGIEAIEPIISAGAGGSIPMELQRMFARLQRQRPVALHQFRPAAWNQAAHVAYGLGNAQPGRRIGSPCPVELRLVAERITVADYRGVQAGLTVATDMQERGAFGRAQPLVGIAGVVRSAQCAQRKRHHARRVGAVDEGSRRRGRAILRTRRATGNIRAVGLVT